MPDVVANVPRPERRERARRSRGCETSRPDVARIELAPASEEGKGPPIRFSTTTRASNARSRASRAVSPRRGRRRARRGPRWCSNATRGVAQFATTAVGSTAGQQLVEHRPVQLQGPVLVGVGQGRAVRGGDAQVAELAFAAAEPAADLPQGMGPAELAEEHDHDLAPAGEAPGMPLGMGPLDQRLELRPWKELEELAEHAAESTHG